MSFVTWTTVSKGQTSISAHILIKDDDTRTNTPRDLKNKIRSCFDYTLFDDDDIPNRSPIAFEFDFQRFGRQLDLRVGQRDGRQFEVVQGRTTQEYAHVPPTRTQGSPATQTGKSRRRMHSSHSRHLLLSGRYKSACALLSSSFTYFTLTKTISYKRRSSCQRAIGPLCHAHAPHA